MSDDDAARGAASAPASTPEGPKPPPPGPFTESRVQEIVRANFDKIGACVAAGLADNPELSGSIDVHLAIAGDGTVLSATADKGPKRKPPPKKKKRRRWRKKKKKPDPKRITDVKVVTCVEDEFKSLRFPETGRGLVNMVYPLEFALQQ